MVLFPVFIRPVNQQPLKLVKPSSRECCVPTVNSSHRKGVVQVPRAQPNRCWFLYGFPCIALRQMTGPADPSYPFSYLTLPAATPFLFPPMLSMSVKQKQLICPEYDPYFYVPVFTVNVRGRSYISF